MDKLLLLYARYCAEYKSKSEIVFQFGRGRVHDRTNVFLIIIYSHACKQRIPCKEQN